MTPSRRSLLLGCFIVTLALYPACAFGGYAGPQIVVSSKGQVTLEVMVTAGTGALLTNSTTRNRTSVIRWLGLDAFIGYNFSAGKLVGGLGNVMSVGYRPAFATSGHEARFGSRFRFGGGHGFQGGFHVNYAHVRVLEAKRDFPTCPAEGSESQFWMGPTIGAEIWGTNRGNNRGEAMSANFLVGTAMGSDSFSQGGFMLSACGEPDE